MSQTMLRGRWARIFLTGYFYCGLMVAPSCVELEMTAAYEPVLKYQAIGDPASRPWASYILFR